MTCNAGPDAIGDSEDQLPLEPSPKRVRCDLEYVPTDAAIEAGVRAAIVKQNMTTAAATPDPVALAASSQASDTIVGNPNLTGASTQSRCKQCRSILVFDICLDCPLQAAPPPQHPAEQEKEKDKEKEMNSSSSSSSSSSSDKDDA
jgi:hypothetical protein